MDTLNTITEPLNTLLESIECSDMVLDAGAGDLQQTNYLNDLGYSVLPIDIFIPEKINKGIMFVKSSIEYLPFRSDVFDSVYCFSVIGLVEIQKPTKEFYRVLKSDSIYIFTVFSSISIFRVLRDLEIKLNIYKNNPEFNPKNYDYYMNSQVKKELYKFRLVQLYGYDLNFIPRLFSLFIKMFGINNIDRHTRTTLFTKKLKRYCNWLLVELSYHKIIVCKKEKI
jgi:SAM-dependent methyltransferase